jgi:hypothetical protein
MYSVTAYPSGMVKRPLEKLPNLDEPDDRLRWLRERAGFEDATSAAKRFGWNENTYRSHENGNRQISKKAAVQYGRAYKVPSGWILYGEGAMTPPIDPDLVTLWENITPEGREALKGLLRQMRRKIA